jgi:predicted metal-binding membrane protein
MTIMASMGMVANAQIGAADLFMTWIMWSVMMIGMMSASAAPVLLLFAATQARRDRDGVRVVVPMFGLGYLAVWLGFSAAATLAQSALHQAALLSPAMNIASSRLSAAILIGAGVYQLTRAKNVCLTHCQSPLGFLMSNWRDGVRGAARMGFRHGLYCLGCCWATMGVLFVVGVMNLAWVGLLTAFILLERLGRAGVLAARVGGILMVAAGAFLA